MYLGVFLGLPSLRSPQHWSRLSDSLHPEAGCVGGSKDLADEKAGMGAGWDGVKKASSKELTPTEMGPEMLRELEGAWIQSPGTVQPCVHLLTSPDSLSMGAGYFVVL